MIVDELNIKDSSILLVDDRQENLLILEVLLKKKGYGIDRALSGKSALKKCLKNNYDLFIIDAQMPEMDGFELAQHLKSTERTRDIPIIFTTALIRGEKFIERGYKTGAVDYLFKPIDPVLLNLKVKAFLQLYHQQLGLKRLKKNPENIVEERTAELKASEVRNSAMLHAIPDLIFRISGKGVIKDYQAKDQHDLYASPEQFLGKNIKYVLPMKLAGECKRLCRNAIKTNKLQLIEYDLEFPEGPRSFEGRIVKSEKDEALMIVRNVTISKNVKTQLIQSEEKYKTVVRQALEAIYMFNPKTKRIIEANETFYIYLGYAAKDIEKLTVYDIVSHDKKNVDTFIKEVLKTGRVDVGERNWRKKNGSEIIVLASASKVQLANKDIVVVTARDITLQKQTEEKLRVRNHELDTFVYKASHDLRSPLASTLGLISLGKEEAQDKVALKYLDLIHQSMYKLDEILEDLTQLTIIRQGKIEITPIKLTSFIKDIVQGFERYPQFDTIDFRIKNSLKGKLKSDPRLLKTILRNIIENAVKYRKYQALDSCINITVEGRKNIATFRISDNGMGIAKEYQKNVFDMFYRATETSKGSGLGLYIVKNAVEKLDGFIELESDKKKGTMFSIYIPKHEIRKL